MTGRGVLRACVLECNNWGSWSEGHRKGLTASSLPYGIGALEAEGFRLLHRDRYSWGSEAALNELVRRAETRFDRRFAQALTALPDLLSADVGLTLFEDYGRSYIALQRLLGKKAPPLAVITCWMGQRALTDSLRQHRLLRQVAQGASLLTVFSANQVPLFVQRFGVPKSKVNLLDFGIDTEFYRPAGPPQGKGYVASVGMDHGRDWPTLLAAAAMTPEVRYRVAVIPERLAGLDVPPNVELVGTLNAAGYRALLQGADVVAVTPYPLAYPGGQSVILEAYACGRPVVATTSPALRDYLPSSAALAAKAGDPQDVAAKILCLARDPERRQEMGSGARHVAISRFDQRLMWAKVAELLRNLA